MQWSLSLSLSLSLCLCVQSMLRRLSRPKRWQQGRRREIGRGCRDAGTRQRRRRRRWTPAGWGRCWGWRRRWPRRRRHGRRSSFRQWKHALWAGRFQPRRGKLCIGRREIFQKNFLFFLFEFSFLSKIHFLAKVWIEVKVDERNGSTAFRSI